MISSRIVRHGWKIGLAAGAVISLPCTIAMGADAPVLKVDGGDTAWVLISAALVMLMTPGLAFFYGGLVRRKNVLSVLMQYRSHKEAGSLLRKVKLEIAVNDAFVQPTIDAIIAGARTGTIGDGKIFVFDLPRCIRIRTGEEGSEAIG